MSLELTFANFKLENIGGSQMHGILQKKPVGHKSVTWSRRFFVLKENFLLYYAETERKNFIDKGFFNIHPKGIIPLGGCKVEQMSLTGVNYGIVLSFRDQSNSIFLGADTDEQRQLWIAAIDKASTVTRENFDLRGSIIKSVQEQILQITNEKNRNYQMYLEKAEESAMIINEKKDLEQLCNELSEENIKLESLINQLVERTDAMNWHDKEVSTYQKLTENRAEILEQTENIYQKLEVFSNEKTNLRRKLEDGEISNRNTQEMNEKMEELTSIVSKLEEEKKNFEKKLKENEELLLQQTKEKSMMYSGVENLKLEIHELNEEKKTFEAKLKEEIFARRELQKELTQCRASLEKLELEVMNFQSMSPDEEDTDKKTNLSKAVKNLKDFFEEFSVENSTNLSSNVNRQRTSRRYTEIKKLRFKRKSNSSEEDVSNA